MQLVMITITIMITLLENMITITIMITLIHVIDYNQSRSRL